VPFAYRLLRDEAEDNEHDKTECARQDDGGDELRTPEATPIDVDLGADSHDPTLAEIEVSDDRANHAQSGGDAKADEDVRHRRGKLQLGESRPLARAMQREQFVLALLD
jgi:hypothetical protein